jgi:tetratricopeptide (TPR) repeat protein
LFGFKISEKYGYSRGNVKSNNDCDLKATELIGNVKSNNDCDLKATELMEEGTRLTQLGDYSNAVQRFNLAIDQNREFAEAYFRRGACYYMLGYYRRATDDLNAASLFGCQAAQLWSKFETNRFDGEENEDDEF